MAIDNREDRRWAVEFFLQFVQAAPESLQSKMSGDNFARMIIDGSEKLGEYLISGKKEN